MDNYKLMYLDLNGIGEPIRLLFKYADVAFEDNRVDPKTWYDVNTTFKWQQLPYLEFNGQILTQSNAIGNFLARKFNLAPEDTWDQAKCEEIFGAVNDLRLLLKPLIVTKFGGNMERTTELKNQLEETTVPLYLKNLNELLEDLRNSKDNAGTDLILGGANPTWTDFCLANFMEMAIKALDEPNLLDKYLLLKKQQRAVYELPRIAEWIAERPETFI